MSLYDNTSGIPYGVDDDNIVLISLLPEEVEAIRQGYYPPRIEQEVAKAFAESNEAVGKLQQLAEGFNVLCALMQEQALVAKEAGHKVNRLLVQLTKDIRDEAGAAPTITDAEMLYDWANSVEGAKQEELLLPELPSIDIEVVQVGGEELPLCPCDEAVRRAENRASGDPENTRRDASPRTYQLTVTNQAGIASTMEIQEGGAVERALRLQESTRQTIRASMEDSAAGFSLTVSRTPDGDYITTPIYTPPAPITEVVVPNPLSDYYRECARMHAEDEAAGRIPERRSYASYQEEAKQVATINQLRRIVGLAPLRTL